MKMICVEACCCSNDAFDSRGIVVKCEAYVAYETSANDVMKLEYRIGVKCRAIDGHFLSGC